MKDASVVSLQAAIAEIGFVIRPVVGTRMMPLMNQNTDTIRLIKAPDRLKKYDIPLYVRPSGEHVLHRIVMVKDNHYVIRGDNTNYTEIVPFDWVIAVADGCSQNGVWHSFDEPNMVKYAKRTVRFWHIRNLLRDNRCFIRSVLFRIWHMFRRK